MRIQQSVWVLMQPGDVGVRWDITGRIVTPPRLGCSIVEIETSSGSQPAFRASLLLQCPPSLEITGASIDVRFACRALLGIDGTSIQGGSDGELERQYVIDVRGMVDACPIPFLVPATLKLNAGRTVLPPIEFSFLTSRTDHVEVAPRRLVLRSACGKAEARIYSVPHIGGGRPAFGESFVEPEGAASVRIEADGALVAWNGLEAAPESFAVHIFDEDGRSATVPVRVVSGHRASTSIHPGEPR